jgi:hypothetical protein
MEMLGGEEMKAMWLVPAQLTPSRALLEATMEESPMFSLC